MPLSHRRPPAGTRQGRLRPNVPRLVVALGHCGFPGAGHPKGISTIRCMVLRKVYSKECSRLVLGWKKPLCGHTQRCDLKERVSYRSPAPRRSRHLQGLCSPTASAVGPRQLVAKCLEALSVGSRVTGCERRGSRAPFVVLSLSEAPPELPEGHA